MVASATKLAEQADDLERQEAFGPAREAHLEAARLFRLAGVGAVAGAAQAQLRELARHHESRARLCDTAAGEPNKKSLVTTPQVLSPRPRQAEESDAAKEMRPAAFEAPAVDAQTWDLWRPLETLMEKIFPKDVFGASPPKQDAQFGSGGGASLRDNVASSGLFEEEEPDNTMLESFYVVPDYQPPEPTHAVMALTKKESSLLNSVIQGKVVLEDDNANLRRLVEKLHSQLDEAMAENRKLQIHVGELEKEKAMMRHSVALFREEIGKSMIAARHSSPASPTAPLEMLLDYEARNALRDSQDPGKGGVDSRSPSPDMQEYIRGLERKVEQQQQKLDEWSRFYSSMAKK